MKLRKCARWLLVLTPFLAGCGNFWQPPSGSSGSGTTPTTLSSGYFYLINTATSQIVAYDINSGKLNQIGAYTLAAVPAGIAIAPNGSFLYVSTLAGIYLYSVGSGGGLTIGNNGGVVSSDPAAAIAVDTSGSWLLDAVQGTSGVTLNATPITSSGTFTGGTVGTQSFSFATSTAAVEQMAISSDDANVFVALGTGGTIIDPFTSGNTNPLGSKATVIAPVTTGGAALSVAVDPSVRVFYIGESLASGGTSGGLRVFNYSSLGGSLTQATGSPIASGGGAPDSILPISSGDYVYVANGTGLTSTGNIIGFSIASNNGTNTVAKSSTVAAGVQPCHLAEDTNANFVLSACAGGGPDLEAFIFDSTTAGQLDETVSLNNSTTNPQSVGVAAVAP